MHYRILEPAKLVDDGASMIIMPNHLGASVYDDMGPKAQEVANLTRHRTLTYDRRATGHNATWNLLERQVLSNDYVGAVALTGKTLAKIVAHEGASEVHIAAQSAAGMEGTTLVRSETLPANRLTCMDTIGIRHLWVTQGLGGWLRHGIKEHHDKTPTHWPNKEQASDKSLLSKRTTAQSRHGMAELWTHANVYTRPISRANLLHIARRMPGVAMNVLFADTTFTLPPYQARQLGRRLLLARELAAGQDKAKVEFEVLHAYHSHFDPADVYAGYVKHTYGMPVGSQPV